MTALALPVSPLPGAEPETPADPPKREAPAGSGLARRPNPKLAERTKSGLALKPFLNHRKLGAVYHTVAAPSFSITAPLSGLQSSPQNLAGYVVARVPMEAASNGALGPVLTAGQWQVPWTSILDAATLARWSTAQGGPLKLDEFPTVALTIRNAVDTKLLSKDESSSAYMCTIVADISINGITTERVIQRTMVSFLRAPAADLSIKGEQLTLRAQWVVRLADFFSSLPGETSVPMVDVTADLLMSTVSPDGQKNSEDTSPQESSPTSGESDTPPSEPADSPRSEPK
ncbi:MAG: hypothetical protein KF691_12205 [Phycisphaeraceae bacterium]|nr:hypothetical protein [Phycisphaeraceae bacterium]